MLTCYLYVELEFYPFFSSVLYRVRMGLDRHWETLTPINYTLYSFGLSCTEWLFPIFLYFTYFNENISPVFLKPYNQTMLGVSASF